MYRPQNSFQLTWFHHLCLHFEHKQEVLYRRLKYLQIKLCLSFKLKLLTHLKKECDRKWGVAWCQVWKVKREKNCGQPQRKGRKKLGCKEQVIDQRDKRAGKKINNQNTYAEMHIKIECIYLHIVLPFTSSGKSYSGLICLQDHCSPLKHWCIIIKKY